jgi:hypothetical protein
MRDVVQWFSGSVVQWFSGSEESLIQFPDTMTKIYLIIENGRNDSKVLALAVDGSPIATGSSRKDISKFCKFPDPHSLNH